MYLAGNILLALATLAWLLILKSMYGSTTGHGPDIGIFQAGHPSELYPDRFLFDVEKCLLAVDRLKAQADFNPAISALKKALGTDHGKRDFSFKAEARIDQWMKKQGN